MSYNNVLALNTKKAPVNRTCAQSVAFSHYNNLSAQLPIDPKTGEIVAGGIKEQAIQCFENIRNIVESINHNMNDVIRISIFVSNIKDTNTVDEVYKTYFQTYLPTRTVVAVNAIPMDALVQVDALISWGEGTIPDAPQAGDLVKLTSSTVNAPICPLSTQSVAFSHYNNITAQLPINPKIGRIIAETAKDQAMQCLENIKSVLTSIDVAIDDIVKMTIQVTDLSFIDEIMHVYRRFLPDTAIARTVAYTPALTIVEVAALPYQALVQMEAVVSHGDGTPPQAIEDRHGIVIWSNNTNKAPISKDCTQTVAFSHYNHLSSQYPIDVKGNMVAGGIKEQVKQCLSNIKAIIENIDHVLEDVVKVNVYLTNLDDMDTFDEVYQEYFPSGTPARRIVGVKNIINGAKVQIDAIVSNAEGTPPKR